MTAWTGLAEAISAYPDGTSTASRFAMTASQLGYDAVIIRNSGALADEPPTSTIREEFGIDVVESIEVTRATPDDISGQLPQLREQTEMLLVAGGSESMNRFVSSQHHVDVLTDPIGPDGPDIDPGIATQARENEVAIELNLAPIKSNGGDRVRYLDRLHRLWKTIDHYDAPYVITVSPVSHLQLLAPREASALGDLVGLEEADIRTGLAAWLDIVAANRRTNGE